MTLDGQAQQAWDREPRKYDERAKVRFDTKVTKSETGCWLWVGALSDTGYGTFHYKGRNLGAHQFSMLFFNDTEPPTKGSGWVVDHVCENKGCVNPKHLRIITHAHNVQGNTSPLDENGRPTHCVHGHEFTDANVYESDIKAGRNLRCRTCVKKANREAMRRKSARLRAQGLGVEGRPLNDYNWRDHTPKYNDDGTDKES